MKLFDKMLDKMIGKYIEKKFEEFKPVLEQVKREGKKQAAAKLKDLQGKALESIELFVTSKKAEIATMFEVKKAELLEELKNIALEKLNKKK